MSSIIIGFSKPRKLNLLSRIIMMFEKTPFSHVYIKIPNNYFKDCDIYQASKGMVNHIVEVNFLNYNISIKEFKLDVDSDNKFKIIQFLRARLGSPYSFKALIVIFLRRLGFKLKTVSDKKESYICSELGARVLVHFGSVNIDVDLDLITPLQLFNILDKMNIKNDNL